MFRKSTVAAIISGAVLGTAGLFAGHFITHPAAGPASCAVPYVAGHQDATSLASGDAGYLWLPGAHSLSEFVCTDGTLVQVLGYGNSDSAIQMAGVTVPIPPGIAA